MSETKSQRRLKYGISSVAAVLIMAGILVAVNVIATRLFVRADLTEQKEFTVSKSTKQILKGLDDIVTVKVFFSKKLPPQLATLEQQVGDMLKEYEVYSDGKVQVQYLDPAEDQSADAQARAMGIPQIQMNVLEKDQFQVRNVYMGIGVQFGDKIQAIPVVQDVSTLEYDLTSSLLKVTRNEQTTLGFLTGHGEKDLQKDYQSLQDLLNREYKVRPVNLNEGRTPVPEEITTLIVAGPKSVGDRDKYQLDQFVMRGGKVIFLIDSITMNEQMGLQAFPSSSGLEDLLTSYGATVRSGLVLDMRNSMASFAAGYISYTTPYPFWPKVTSEGLNPHNPISSRLESLVFPWTAPIDLTVPQEDAGTKGGKGAGTATAAETDSTGGTQPGVHGIVLASSSDKAWIQSGRYDLNPQSPLIRSAAPTGEKYPLAVALTGTFRSYYADHPVPPPPAEATEEGGTPPPTPVEPPEKTESPDTRMLVVGNSQFVNNTFLRLFPENALFLQNAVDWLSLSDELIAIRSRGATERPIRELSEGAKTAIKYLLTFGVPALVVLIGLLRGVLRRRSRERLNRLYRTA